VTDTYVDDAGVGRRELLKKTAIGGGLVVAALAASGLTGTAEAKGGKSFNFDVDVDESSFEAAGIQGRGARPILCRRFDLPSRAQRWFDRDLSLLGVHHFHWSWCRGPRVRH